MSCPSGTAQKACCSPIQGAPSSLVLLVMLKRVLLLLAAQVIMGDTRIQCGPDEYPHNNLCCKNCTSGEYMSKHCTRNHHVGKCEACEHETYMAHSSGLNYCLPCTQCREDQEVVTNCTRTRNRQCRCKTGFYCEPADCEMCRACLRCPEGTVILHPCNATADTACVNKKGNANLYLLFMIIPVLLFIVYIYRCKRKGTPLFSRVISFFKERSSNPGSPIPNSSPCGQALMHGDVEAGHPAPDMQPMVLLKESSVAVPENGTPSSFSKDLEEVLVEKDRGEGPGSTAKTLS
ncbi:tumor necrosis factor receptor superfamily member 6-like [Dugong dugon]